MSSIAGKLQPSETVGPGSCSSKPEHSQDGADDEVNLGAALRVVQVLVRVTDIQRQTDVRKGLSLFRLMGVVLLIFYLMPAYRKLTTPTKTKN